MKNLNPIGLISVAILAILLIPLVFDYPRPVFAQVNTYDSGIVTVPDSDTLLRTGDFVLKTIHCSNNTGSAATLSITNNAATPITYFPAISMAANSVMVANYGELGIKMDGIRWTQGTTGAIECQVVGKVN